MKQLLITGFDPFDGSARNPSWEAVQLLPDRIGCWQLHKKMLPTIFGEAARLALEEAMRCGAQAIVCVGVAQGRSCVTPERIAVNLRDAARKDNSGAQPEDQPCIPGGPDAYFSDLPVKAMAQAAGGKVSLSAGSFVCNDTLYTLLHRTRGSGIAVGFIHVPQIPEQTEGVSMPLEQTAQALEAAIAAMA